MIHQSLALSTFDRFDCSFAIGHFAVSPSEAKLIAVAVQVLLGKLMEDSIVSTLQESEEGFRSIGVNNYPVLVLACVFPDSVLDRSMQFRVISHALVKAQFVSHNNGFLSYVNRNFVLERLAVHSLQRTRSSATITLDQNKDRRFSRAASPNGWTSPSSLARLPADKSFINFRDAGKRIAWFILSHGFTDAMGHVPSTSIRAKTQFALKLKSAYALLARAHEMEGHNPLLKSDMAVFHDAADCDRKLLPARIALNRSRAGSLTVESCYVLAVAMRTDRAVRPADFFQVPPGIVLSHRSKLNQIHGTPLFLFVILIERLCFVKCIIRDKRNTMRDKGIEKAVFSKNGTVQNRRILGNTGISLHGIGRRTSDRGCVCNASNQMPISMPPGSEPCPKSHTAEAANVAGLLPIPVRICRI
jgi:hypothetical protein